MCCETLQGFLAGMVDNTIGTNLRSGGNTQAFRNGVSTANSTSLAISTILLVDGAVNTGAGAAGLVGSGVAAATVVGAPVAAGGAAVSGALLAKGTVELTIGGVMMANTLSNMKDDASADSNSSSSSSSQNTETSKTKKERVETNNDLESALNQDSGIEKAQQAAKKQVKGAKQNKIQSKAKSEQRVNHQLKRIDVENLDDF